MYDLQNADTNGNTVLNITGNNFGLMSPLSSLNITIGSRPCLQVAMLSLELLQCVTPSGAGVNQAVNVIVASQISVNSLGYNYSAPIVSCEWNFEWKFY